uniref:Uncharacterized protein n=1 Tax=Avena sativa TaxID=4498 RepID=A0ACD5W6N2_AVESA
MPELGGMLAAALLKVVADQIGSVIGGQIALQKNLSQDLEKMKMALESVEAVLEDAEARSITDRSTGLWLKRLKVAMYAISDMIDEFDAGTQAITRPSKQKFSMNNYLAFFIPCLTIGPKITLASKMKTMTVDLDEITGQHKKFNLLASTNSTELKVPDERETSSNMYAQIFGRTEERDSILATLSKIMTKEITIFPIYGIGGLGKTTLAQMVYSSSQFKDYSRVWVYVSQTFGLKKIGNSIISQLSQKEIHYTEMQMIDNSLSKLFDDKKILIVLDDLWEDKKINLDRLKGMLNVGSGSNVVVIVTTRTEGIAMEVCTIKPHKLSLLSNGMCWSIIKHKSDFKSRDDKNELKQIGKDIASKCGGVALAAQALGYVLKSMKFVSGS